MPGQHFVADTILVFTCDLCIVQRILGSGYGNTLGAAGNIQKRKECILLSDWNWLIRYDLHFGIIVNDAPLLFKGIQVQQDKKSCVSRK